METKQVEESLDATVDKNPADESLDATAEESSERWSDRAHGWPVPARNGSARRDESGLRASAVHPCC